MAADCCQTFAYSARKAENAMRLLAALCVLGLAGCGENKTASASPHGAAPATPSAVESAAPETVWNAVGAGQAMITEVFRGGWADNAESCRVVGVAVLRGYVS